MRQQQPAGEILCGLLSILIMSSALPDSDVVLTDKINDTICVIDPPAPGTRIFSFEGFGFTKPFKRAAADVLQ